MAELKRIDLNTGAFVANGVSYQLEKGLSIERFAELQILQLEMGFSIEFKALYAKFEKGYQLLNKQRFADSAVLLNDAMRGIAKAADKKPAILKICSLFINFPEEDRTIYSQDTMDKKILDWSIEGIDIRDFFLIASAQINGFSEIYRTVTRAISEPDKPESLQAKA